MGTVSTVTGGERTADGGGSYAEIIRTHSRRRIEIFAGAGDVWRFAESLKSISEDTAQEYEGRALFELIQNGYDALGEGGRGRVRIILAEGTGEFGTLYVANEGQPFAESNFKAITELGLSDKAAGEGIGNKGLGFRSVLQLTDWPEVYSKAHVGSQCFDGFCFRFATPSDVTALVEDPALAREVIAKVSPLALPVPADPGDVGVETLASEGFSTVIRLPLRNDRAKSAAVEQLAALAAYEVPVLLFLDRLTSVAIECAIAEPWGRELSRTERRFEPLDQVGWLTEVDLGQDGRYLQAVRSIPAAALREAIEASITAHEIDEKWRDWDGDAAVSVAVGLDEPIDRGRLYTFLPMSEHAVAPFAGHAHAPFFTKLARLDISDGVALNRYLVGQLAALARDLLRELTKLDKDEVPLGTTIDLACWSPPDRMTEAFDEAGLSVLTEAFVPVMGTARWGTLEEAFCWPYTGTAVINARALTRLGVKVVDEQLDESRLARLEEFHRALLGRSMAPEAEESAEWGERLAARLHRDRVSVDRWVDFYDDLAAIFRGKPAALGGRSIILDQDGQLTRALGGGDDQASKQTVFFAPDEAGSDESASRVPKDLRALRRRIAFTHPDLPWNVPGNPPRRRPGRSFLEPVLVREYRTDRVFEAIDELLQHAQSEAFRRDALLFAYRQFATLNESQRGQLRRYSFHVPTEGGSWRRATEALFHPAWGTEAGELLDSFLGNGGDSIPEFARLRDRRTAPPSAWPESIGDVADWRTFLKHLGVRDGLILYNYDARRTERDGNSMRPERLASLFKLNEELSREWPALVRTKWSDFAHPWTRYAFDQPLAHLPGAEAAQRLGARARRELAELTLLALPSWADHHFAVRVRRPGRAANAQDLHVWPTPLAAQLRSLPWIPLTDESAADGLRFVRPDEAWFAPEGELPAFVPSLPGSVRRLLQDETALRRLKDSGLRVWGDRRNGPELVREFGDLLDAGSVPAHLTVHFRKHYQRGWAETVMAERWPWSSRAELRLAVTELSSLATADQTEISRVFVPDEDDQLKESLLDLAGYPVLVASAENGSAIRRLFAANGIQVSGFTDTEVKIEADGSAVSATADRPLLVDDAPWLPMLFGLVLELKSGEFRRRSERAVRDLMDRVGAIRVARAGIVNVVIEAESTGTPAAARSLPVADERYPTIVVWDAEPGWPELRAASPSICQLTNQPGLQAPLELALVKLESWGQGDVPTAVEDEALALALDTPIHKVAELRRGLTGELVELVHRLRPALVSTLGINHLDDISRALQRVTDVTSLSDVLNALALAFGISTPGDELLATARHAGSLAELRDQLSIDFGQFNDALTALGEPYRPITHPDLQAQAFTAFFSEVESQTLDLLRERYSPLALAGEDVAAYVAGRRFEGLEPDPGWLIRYESPPRQEMQRVVSSWLATHGARDLDSTAKVPDLAKLRQRNFTMLDSVVDGASQRISAWCREHHQPVPPGWTSLPVATVRGLVEGQGIADLLDLSEQAILERSAGALGWPSGMEITMSLEALGLSAEHLLREPDPSAGSSRTTKPAPTIEVGGRTIEVGHEQLIEIARAAHSTIDEAFLSQRGLATLGDAPATGSTGGGTGGGRIVVARMPRMTEDQRSAVGLVGEIAARAWLERRYEGVRWRSGYAAIVTADAEASDSWGYDFEVPHRNSSLLFEVKSLVDEPRDLTEFEMGESEVRVAQTCAGGDRYRLLLVTSVLEPAARRVFLLPSPFSKKGAGRFRVIGRGLRYRCQLAK